MTPIYVGPVTFEPRERILSGGEFAFRVSRLEASALTILMRKADRVVSKAEFRDAVWGCNPPARILTAERMMIGTLRKFMGHLDLDGEQIIKTVQGFGYQFNNLSIQRRHVVERAELRASMSVSP